MVSRRVSPRLESGSKSFMTKRFRDLSMAPFQVKREEKEKCIEQTVSKTAPMMFARANVSAKLLKFKDCESVSKGTVQAPSDASKDLMGLSARTASTRQYI